jgi:hypothetical protein
MEYLSNTDLYHIIHYLNVEDLLNLAKTCHNMYQFITTDKIISRQLIKQYLTNSPIIISNPFKEISKIKVLYTQMFDDAEIYTGVDSFVLRYIATNGYEKALEPWSIYVEKTNVYDIIDTIDYELEEEYQNDFISDGFFDHFYFYAGLNNQLKFIQYLETEELYNNELHKYDNGPDIPIDMSVSSFFQAVMGIIHCDNPDRNITLNYLLHKLHLWQAPKKQNLIDFFVYHYLFGENYPDIAPFLSSSFIIDGYKNIKDLRFHLIGYALSLSKTLEYFKRIYQLIDISINELIEYIPLIRFNSEPNAIDIAKYIVSLTKDERKLNRILETNRDLWTNSIERLARWNSIRSSDNIAKMVEYLMEAKISSKEFILIDVE